MSAAQLGGSEARARRGGRSWKRVALALSAVLLELLLLEAGLALFGVLPPEPRAQVGEYRNHERKRFDADPDFGWRMKPGTSFRWRTEGQEFPFLADAAGFRIDERPDAPTAVPGAPRIALLGDSFTFGTGVHFHETFGAQLAASLGGVAENRAQPGYGIDQIWQVAEKVVLAGPPPDLLVVAVILDDFERTLHAYRHAEGFNKPRFRVVDGRPVPSGAEHNLGPLARFVDRTSRLATLWKAVERRFGQKWGVGAWWELNRACLDALFDAAARRGVRVLVVHLATAAAWRPFPALRQLVERRRAAGEAITSCDLAVQWQSAPADAFWPEDGHLNAVGHAKVAELLAAQVRSTWPDWPR
ncbi:MAG: SGNH/GDSL hydrolase family protein [Planctomycetes bacterium]|nr:SGNH/GDSL hydrolase family protein [Planctomycetota bacterium]